MSKKLSVRIGTNCEHCGELEIGSFVHDDGGTSWCLWCAASMDSYSNITELADKEVASKITAHKERIRQLERKS